MNNHILVGIIALLFFLYKFLLSKLTSDPHFQWKTLLSDTIGIWIVSNFAFFLGEQLAPFLSIESPINQVPEIFLTEPGF